MATSRPNCFVIMPFAPELNCFYLYLALHIEREHGILCRRADQRFSTRPVREKIDDYVRGADIIIADCSGNNPNVLYELGIAHTLDKDCILITQDSTSAMPSDIRLFEFLKYDLAHHLEFLAKLDAAIGDLLVARYDRLYADALRLFDRYTRETSAAVQRVAKETFLATVKAAEGGEGLPRPEDTPAFAGFVLPAIVQKSDDNEIMSGITSWLLQLG